MISRSGAEATVSVGAVTLATVELLVVLISEVTEETVALGVAVPGVLALMTTVAGALVPPAEIGGKVQGKALQAPLTLTRVKPVAP